MTAAVAIGMFDSAYPNDIPRADKLAAISELDGIVNISVYGRYTALRDDGFKGYGRLDGDKKLKIPFPYDGIYLHRLRMLLGERMGDASEYNNALSVFNTLYDDFVFFIARSYIADEV